MRHYALQIDPLNPPNWFNHFTISLVVSYNDEKETKSSSKKFDNSPLLSTNEKASQMRGFFIDTSLDKLARDSIY